MARTSLMHEVQRAAAQAAAPTRRELLSRAAAAGAAASLGSMARWVPEANAATAPRIVIVGAGLAGLTCAYRLRQGGYSAQVHEASDRVGGRCWTIRGAFAEGQVAEHGGELIDQGHTGRSGNTPPSPAPNASSPLTATSPASTPQSTSRATSTAA
jgi:hypothetical protein